jgi:hypothetical protein
MNARTVVGGDFDYDVFYSYPWSLETDDVALREWSRMVIDQINKMIRVSLNSHGRHITPYLDRDTSVSGESLDQTLKAAIEKAALVVFFIGEFSGGDYCKKELDWFLEAMRAKGASVAERASIFRIQPVTDEWPPQLVDGNGKKLTYKDLCNEDGPLDMAEFLNETARPLLPAAVRSAVLEIVQKLRDIKDAIAARETYRQSQKPPNRPVMYFEAERSDEMRWSEVSLTLSTAPSIVLPGPTPATEDPIALYRDCDALVMLRSRLDDNISERIRRAYLGRRQILKDQKARVIPWVLLDFAEPAPPEVAAFEMPRIVPRGDWVADLRQALVVD